jgi:uncharacterized membrane protein
MIGKVYFIGLLFLALGIILLIIIFLCIIPTQNQENDSKDEMANIYSSEEIIKPVGADGDLGNSSVLLPEMFA